MQCLMRSLPKVNCKAYKVTANRVVEFIIPAHSKVVFGIKTKGKYFLNLTIAGKCRIKSVLPRPHEGTRAGARERTFFS